MNTHTEGNRIYSYGTHVATIDHDSRTVIAHGKWSKTTTNHVNKAARALEYTVTQDPNGQAGGAKVSAGTFGCQRCGTAKEDHDNGGKVESMLPVLRMFAAIADMNPDREQAQKERERLMFATPGVIRPDNWDMLPLEERERRTKGALEASK